MTTSPYLDAVTGGAPAYMPVWFMRQAGRALAEYRAIRKDHGFEEVVHTPDLTAEVTLQPVRRYNVDAAILFSDIVTPLQGIGLPIEIVKGIGPITDGAFRTRADVDRLRPLEPTEDVPYVLESVTILARELGDVPLIGFAGAPFTLASYLIEGKPSRDHAHTKALMRTDPATWELLMTRLSDLVATHLVGQVKAGARAIQLFDSWAGALTPSDYATYARPWSQRVLARVGDLGVPRTHFGVATGELLGLMATEVEVMGVDWRVPLDDLRTRVPAGVATQGNLDPTAVLAGVDVALAGADDVLARVGPRTDHVFNLGHGVLPPTDPGVLAEVVAHVHERTRR